MNGKENWERLAILETKMDGVQKQIDKKFDELNDKIDEYSKTHVSRNEISKKIKNDTQKFKAINDRISRQTKLIKWITGGFSTILMTILAYIINL